MMKHLLILASLVVVLALTACSPSEMTATGCGPATDGTQLLTHEDHGYCLSYPTEYTVEHPDDDETVLVVGSLLTMQQPRAYIEVESAAGRTATQVADEVVAGFEAALPGLAIERSETSVGGESAVVLDGVPGQDISRQVVFVHGDRLYTLTFVPADTDLGEVYTQMEDLYHTVIDSFQLPSGD